MPIRQIAKQVAAAAVWLLAAAGPASAAYTYSPTDFAVELVAYEPGTAAAFVTPTTALGRPTVDSLGDGWFINPAEPAPIVPFYPAWRDTELVRIGHEGHLIVQFEKPVEDHPDNPFGLDLIVFGNAFQTYDATNGWVNRDPDDVTSLSPGSGSVEPGTVSVSQDGQVWYAITNEGDPNDPGPPYTAYDPADPAKRYADAFAPTLGRVYDPDDPHRPDADWDWNHWWAEPTDPTLPLDPARDFAAYGGLTAKEIAEDYGESAGGTGFDVGWLDLPTDPETGRKWFRYVRVDNFRTEGPTPEVDAFADVAPLNVPLGDLDKNGTVGAPDVDLLGIHRDDPEYDAGYDLDGDGDADDDDLDALVHDILNTSYGDANLDGTVGDEDFSALLGNWGDPGTWKTGNFTFNLTVGDEDLSVLLGNWGKTGGHHLPEPATLALAALGAVAVLLRRRAAADV